MKNHLKLLILAFGAILFASCATITKGTSQEVTVTSNVPGALVELDGVELGYTPFKGKVKKGKEGRIKVSKPGYFAGDIEVKKERNYEALISGNFGLGLGIGGAPYFSIRLTRKFSGLIAVATSKNNISARAGALASK